MPYNADTNLKKQVGHSHMCQNVHLISGPHISTMLVFGCLEYNSVFQHCSITLFWSLEILAMPIVKLFSNAPLYRTLQKDATRMVQYIYIYIQMMFSSYFPAIPLRISMMFSSYFPAFKNFGMFLVVASNYGTFTLLQHQGKVIASLGQVGGRCPQICV